MRYVHPRHREAAGWLAWHRPEVRKEILDHDPAALLSPGLPAQTPAVRAEVVDALFAAAEQGTELPQSAALHRAGHPGLGSQLAARITRPAARQASAQERSLELALALARACPDDAPAAALLDVAEDDQALEGIRVAALVSVSPAAVDGAAGRLEALAAAPEAKVSGAALLALWPQRMPTADLLARMPGDLPEMYWQVVERNLQAADTADVAAWMRQQLRGDAVSSWTAILQLLTWMSSLLSPVDGQAPQQPAAAQLADVLILVLHSDHRDNAQLADAAGTWAHHRGWRRLLASEVMARLNGAETTVMDAMQGPLGLMPPEDMVHWGLRAAWTLHSRSNPPKFTEPDDHDQDNPQLGRLTASDFAPVPAGGPNAGRLTAQRGHRTDVNAKLERLTAARPDPDQIRSWWLTIVQWLSRDPQRLDTAVPVHLDLTATASFPPPGSPLRPALQAAAWHALEHAPILTAGTGSPPWSTSPTPSR